MRATGEWLERLRQAEDGSLREYLLPVLSAGIDGLNLSNCLLATEPKGSISPRVGDTAPVSFTILRYLDVARESVDLAVMEDLSSELGSILTLMSEHRLAIPNTLPCKVEGSNAITFFAYESSHDLRLQGPFPENLEIKVHSFLEKIAGLPSDLREIFGTVARLHHSAIEMYENDLRSAYLLIVCGIEILSRQFGSPPGEWADWDASSNWEAAFRSAGLSDNQCEAMRGQLMADKHLRLKATFRSYASNRIPDSFWDEPWKNWMHPFNMPTGKWERPNCIESRLMRDILPQDRGALSSMLGCSYDLRSGLVHRGQNIPFPDRAVPFASETARDRPLPFSILRSILRRLLLTELDSHSTPKGLPPMRLFQPNDPAVTTPMRGSEHNRTDSKARLTSFLKKKQKHKK